VYDMEEAEFAEGMKLLVEAGASIVGGCCGTTPSYIQAAKEAVGTMQIRHREPGTLRYLTSERKTVAFGLNDNFMIIGERINPTGKKKLQAQLREGSMEMVSTFAEEQEACGASILDINMGMSGIDEKAMMLQAVETVTGLTSLPLSIDSSHVDVIEAALRRYPGRALINSISYEKVKFEALLPIAKKYGAMFILLPLSDAGLPENLQEKIEIIGKIQKRAFELGMRKEDIIVDGLVATVGANKTAAIETLETIRYCKENGLATTCGLSNISFGLPERSYVNTAFLTMAIQAGLTMAIANPSQELLVSLAFASDLLLNKEGADIRYINLMEAVKAKREAMGETAVKQTGIQIAGRKTEA
ncbi:MAG: dihydropteroate synthase, partial [Lachnospiraceae bacterium]|nr:dihydropteroate synthase [Lachnospiraceae bacterium]